ncbi:MAG: septation regulator SpoVG [Deltaproteobacteria bacterium]|nr:septation regulator SpoVG [Deltaproteobacteria bacterium]
MEITEVRVFPMNEDKLKAYATVTFDDCFVVRDLKVISGNTGLFVAMPSKKRKDGSFKDIAHPLNNDFRAVLEKIVLEAYEKESQTGSAEAPPVEANAPLQSLLSAPNVESKTPDQVKPSDYSAPDD